MAVVVARRLSTQRVGPSTRRQRWHLLGAVGWAVSTDSTSSAGAMAAARKLYSAGPAKHVESVCVPASLAASEGWRWRVRCAPLRFERRELTPSVPFAVEDDGKGDKAARKAAKKAAKAEKAAKKAARQARRAEGTEPGAAAAEGIIAALSAEGAVDEEELVAWREMTSGAGEKRKAEGDVAPMDDDQGDKAASAGDEEVTRKAKKAKKEKKDKKDKKEKKEKKDKKEKRVKGEAMDVDEAGPAASKQDGGAAGGSENDGSAEFPPVESFDAVGFPAEVLKACAGFKKPTAIQARTWGPCMAGRDVVGIAATGSGKTLAFGLPAVVHALKHRDGNKGSPSILVLAPTRELAQQTATVFESVGTSAGMRSVCCYGGVPKREQRFVIRQGVEAVVATPGRLQDLVEEQSLDLSCCSYVVLDEADRLLDLGFEPHVRAILNTCASPRQTLMFSATWPESVRALAAEFARPDPIMIRAAATQHGGEANPDAQPHDGNSGVAGGLKANRDIKQIVEVCEPFQKADKLQQLLHKYHHGQKERCIVFCLYKKEAARVESQLQRKGWRVVSVHGDKTQEAREAALAAFRDGSCKCLIATDVAARGLDIKGVTVVINHTFPLTVEDYVHRIGRTGRAGEKGLAHTLFTKEEKPLAGELQVVLRNAGQDVPQELTKFGTGIKPTKKKEHAMYGAHFRDDGKPMKKATKIVFD